MAMTSITYLTRQPDTSASTRKTDHSPLPPSVLLPPHSLAHAARSRLIERCDDLARPIALPVRRCPGPGPGPALPAQPDRLRPNRKRHELKCCPFARQRRRRPDGGVPQPGAKNRLPHHHDDHRCARALCLDAPDSPLRCHQPRMLEPPPRTILVAAARRYRRPPPSSSSPRLAKESIPAWSMPTSCWIGITTATASATGR